MAGKGTKAKAELDIAWAIKEAFIGPPYRRKSNDPIRDQVWMRLWNDREMVVPISKFAELLVEMPHLPDRIREFRMITRRESDEFARTDRLPISARTAGPARA